MGKVFQTEGRASRIQGTVRQLQPGVVHARHPAGPQEMVAAVWLGWQRDVGDTGEQEISRGQ